MNPTLSPQYKPRKYSAFESDYTNHTTSNTDNQCSFGAKNIRKGSGSINLSSPQYKTEVCNYWENGKQCPYGENCIFAHGEIEVRGRDRDSLPGKYKTKLCKNFHQNQFCPYGQRCQFIHSKSSLSKIKLSNIYEWFSDSYQVLKLFGRLRHQNKITQKQVSPDKTMLNQNQQTQQFSIIQSLQKKQFYQCQDLSQYVLSGYIKSRLYSL